MQPIQAINARPNSPADTAAAAAALVSTTRRRSSRAVARDVAAAASTYMSALHKSIPKNRFRVLPSFPEAQFSAVRPALQQLLLLLAKP